MGGIDLRDGVLEVERAPNQLDELAIAFSGLLTDLDIRHVFVSGYVAILAGRARATEDIDVIIEQVDAPAADRLVTTLSDNGYWGPAMPLSEFHETLANGANIWIAPTDQVSPHLEVKFPTDRFDRASLENAIEASIGGERLPIGQLELQIAYKLYLGTQTDFEDAVHLYSLFGDALNASRIEVWSDQLGVEEKYDELRRA